MIGSGKDMKKERNNFQFYKYTHIFWFISKILNFQRKVRKSYVHSSTIYSLADAR